MSEKYMDILNNYIEMNNFITTIAKQQDEYILGELNAKVNMVMGVDIEPSRLEKWVRQSMFIEKFTVEQLRDFAIDRLARRLLKEKDQQIQSLEHRLANCIEPKFKQGDYLYSVEKSGSQILLAEGYVTTITQLDDGSIWYHLSVKPHEFGVRENTCYKTMDEVHEVSQKLLKEIDNEQNNRKS